MKDLFPIHKNESNLNEVQPVPAKSIELNKLSRTPVKVIFEGDYFGLMSKRGALVRVEVFEECEKKLFEEGSGERYTFDETNLNEFVVASQYVLDKLIKFSIENFVTSEEATELLDRLIVVCTRYDVDYVLTNLEGFAVGQFLMAEEPLTWFENYVRFGGDDPYLYEDVDE